MASFVLCAPNWVDTATVSRVFGGGGWQPTLSPSNLNAEFFTEVTRSTDATLANTKFTVDLGAQRTVGFVGIPDSNLTNTALIRTKVSNTVAWSGVTINGAHSAADTTLDVTAATSITVAAGDVFTISGDVTTYQVTVGGTGTSITLTIKRVASASAGLTGALSGSEEVTCHTGDFTSPLVDSGWVDYFPEVFPVDGGGLFWGDARIWTRKYSAEDLSRLNLPRQYIYLFPNRVFARYVSVEIDDTTNGDGYVQADGLYITDTFQPRYNMSYGLRFGLRSNTTKESARGGADAFEKRKAQRYVDFTLDFLSDSEAFASLFDTDRELDLDGNLFFVYDSADVQYVIRRSFPARFGTLSAITPNFYANNIKTFALEERLA